MSYSSGVFSLVAGNPVVTGTTISSTVMNNTLTDIATGLSTCVLKDGTQTTTVTVPFIQGLSAGATAALTTLTESTGAAWTDYTPTLTADTGTWGTLTVTTAKYRLLGKTLFLRLNLSASVGSGSPTEFRVTYPAGASGKTGNSYAASMLADNGTNVIGVGAQSNAAYIAFQKVPAAAFTGSCQATCNAVFELA